MATHHTTPDENRFTKIVLQQKLGEPMQLQIMTDGKVLYAERKGRLKVFDPFCQPLP